MLELQIFIWLYAEMKKRIVIKVGDTLGNFLILRHVGVINKNSHWFCRCICGTERVFGQPAMRKTDASCGCRRNAMTSARNLKHGHTYRNAITTEYLIWQSIKARCFNTRNKSYKNYGARGITMCKQWLDFEVFLSDMGRRPVGLEIDRIDNNGGYDPGNCRWVTAKEQTRNRRTTKKIDFRGDVLPLAEWCEKLELNYKTVFKRLSLGWTPEKALTAPKMKNQCG